MEKSKRSDMVYYGFDDHHPAMCYNPKHVDLVEQISGSVPTAIPRQHLASMFIQAVDYDLFKLRVALNNLIIIEDRK